jgi:hypothetical protein
MVLNKSSALAAVFAVGLLSGCDRTKPAAQTAPASETFTAPREGGSPHFEKVVKRLDVGGKMIQFQDHDGRRDVFIELLKAVLTNIPGEKLKQEIDPARMIDASGIAQAAASGSSLIKDGDSWLMRSYQYLPAGPQGLARLAGKEPVSFKGPALVPAATDLLVETRLDATFLPEFIWQIGAAAGTAGAGEFLNQKLPNGDTFQALMAKTSLHLILGVDVSTWAEKPVLPKPIDYFVRIEGGRDLLPLLLIELEKTFGKPAAFGTRQGWELPLPAIGMQAKGVLLYDDATLVLASRNDYLKLVELSAEKLAGEEKFKAATNHFPQSGNILFYASPQVPPVLGWAIRQAAKKEGGETTAMIIKATEYLQPRTYSMCVAYEKDGIATTAELPFAADVNMGAALPVLTATSTLFVGARAWKKGSDRAGCMINTRNIQQAIRGHQGMASLENGSPIPWDKICGKGGYLHARPICPGGATYTFAETVPEIGELACKCSNPDHEPPNHKDW